ncbi:hypothetical protein N658DRAFT_496517 [Parathielavia hyrcaniae]|uniref:Uncharacterized protein n=1 Tax=Parathielavia hyrcaniae TaxID=113614 RepID=A0AAN6T1W0_9PEZI|nr:hypothetical protein N658DRAFT_496517 [Parathielavia hyrcaniae]
MQTTSQHVLQPWFSRLPCIRVEVKEVWAMHPFCSPVRVRGCGINGFASSILPLWCDNFPWHFINRPIWYGRTVRTDSNPPGLMSKFRRSQHGKWPAPDRRAASNPPRCAKAKPGIQSPTQPTRAANPGSPTSLAGHPQALNGRSSTCLFGSWDISSQEGQPAPGQPNHQGARQLGCQTI